MKNISILAVTGLVILCIVYTRADESVNGFKLEILSGHTENCYNGKKSKRGDILVVQYIGILEKTGKHFDSSYERKEPLRFTLGKGQVIQGWDKGLQDMCIGEKRRLTIPPHLAYGSKGAGRLIPPHATLVFEIVLEAIEDQLPESIVNNKNVFKAMDRNDDKEISREEISVYVRLQTKSTKIGSLADDLHYKIVDDILKGQDINKDGKITFEEFKGQKHDEL